MNQDIWVTVAKGVMVMFFIVQIATSVAQVLEYKALRKRLRARKDKAIVVGVDVCAVCGKDLMDSNKNERFLQ